MNLGKYVQQILSRKMGLRRKLWGYLLQWQNQMLMIYSHSWVKYIIDASKQQATCFIWAQSHFLIYSFMIDHISFSNYFAFYLDFLQGLGLWCLYIDR